MSGETGGRHAGLREKRQRRNRRRGIVASLACAVVLITAIALMAPAISMTHDDLDEPQAAGSNAAELLEVQAEDAAGEAAGDAEEAASEPDAKPQAEPAKAPDKDKSPAKAQADAKAAAEPEPAAEPDLEPTATPSPAETVETPADSDGGAQDSDDAPDIQAEAPEPDAASVSGPSGDEPLPGEDAADEPAAQDEGDSPEMPAQSFYGELRDKKDKVTLAVDVDAPEGALPAGATMQVQAVKAKDVQDAIQDALDAEEAGKLQSVQAVDITFLDADGTEVEPAVPVNVKLASPQIAQAADEEANEPLVAHVDAEGKAQLVDVLTDKQLAKRDIQREDDELLFDADSFSVYAIVYTVDFHAEVDGRAFDLSIRGGDSIGLRELLVALGVVAEDDAAAFVRDVADVKASDAALLAVAQVDADVTAAELRQAAGLAPEFSGELSADEIAAMDAKPYTAPDWAIFSLASFDTQETLSITMKAGETFILKVTDARIVRTVMSASGDAYEIAVTYGEEAGIPDDAELKVREIVLDDAGYQDYLTQALGSLSDENPGVLLGADYARFFDIEIRADGKKVEPAAEVSVSIKVLDAPEGDDTDLRVVHFAADGPEAIDAREVGSAKAGKAELDFEADSFSVYSVVNVTQGMNLNGNSYALVTGIAGDPGADVGYPQTWGTDYFTKIVNGMSMEAGDESGGLSSKGVHIWKSGSESYVGSEATSWYFERVNGNDYRIYILENGRKRYVFQGTDPWPNLSSYVGLTPVDNPDWATTFTIVPQSDGTVLIRNENWYLHNNQFSGSNEWSTRNYTMTQSWNVPQGSEYKFRLCELSDDFDSFAAQKVSASTLAANANYVIYRKFLDESGNEALYALASDGTFVRVYDGGDTIYWRETDKNIYWNYAEAGTYHELYSENPTTHQRVYLSPNYTGQSTVSPTEIGLTLIGKDNGEYATAIESWDQSAYDYAGLHVTGSGDAKTLGVGLRTAGTSDEFLFAKASDMPTPATVAADLVETVDSDSLGISITMFDYGDANTAYSAGDKLPDMTAIAGSEEYTPHAAHALVKPYLESGVPSSTSKGAMTGLFSSGGAIKYSQSGVTGLFLKSYYDESGTFRYRSEDNYAYLGLNHETEFKVYRQAATPYTHEDDGAVGHSYYYHGHFMPFNDIDTTKSTSRLLDQYGTDELPVGDGRTYEDIYGVKGIPNFYTGMKMEASFVQPKDGKLENGDDMIFKFTGDDDMWVYIDDVLVLDIGGIHEPLSGTINFRTGKVTNPAGSSLEGMKTLYDIFQDVLKASSTPQSVKDKISAITWKDVDGDGKFDTFADYTNHTFGAFYMERGAGASNLDIQFNLKVVLANQFSVLKNLPDDVDARFVNQQYKFRATYKGSNGQDLPLHAGIDNVCTTVVYKDRKDASGNEVPVEVDQDGYFFLKPGETAVFKMADESIQYNVREVDIDTGLNEKVEVNGQEAAIANGAAEAGSAAVGNRSQVLYTNHPHTQDLLITKHLTEDSAPIAAGENPVFEFRVYLETTSADAQGNAFQQLVPYSYGDYYLVKQVGGEDHYFTLNGEGNAPVDQGANPVVCSTTGRSGTINSIPPEYTIVIPNLAVGTNFYLEERRDNIPEGYSFVREDLKDGTFGETNLDTSADVIQRTIARDEDDHQSFDPETIGRIINGVDAESHVYNRRPLTEVGTTKAWQDADGKTTSWQADVTFKLMKKTVAAAEDGTMSTAYVDVAKPVYYSQNNLSWSQTIVATQNEPAVKWEHLDSIGDNESYVVIESDIEDATDVIRDEASGAVKSFKLGGKTYLVKGGEVDGSAGTTVNAEQPVTEIEVQKRWVTPEGLSAGSSTMVLYQAVGKKAKDLEDGKIDPAKPSSKIRVTVDASLVDASGQPAGTVKSAYIDVAYTGTASGSYRLSNANGWSHTFEFDRGGTYDFTYTADGTKVKTVAPDASAGIDSTTTISLTATVEPVAQHTYTFAVPEGERPQKGGISVTCNGTTQVADAGNDWTVSFSVADEESVTYNAREDGKFITAVTMDPQASAGEEATADKAVALHPTAAALTLSVPVKVVWDKAPDAGTTVTVTFAPDKPGIEPKSVELSGGNGLEWAAGSQELARLDENGELVTWTVSTQVSSPANNASVSLEAPAGAKISDTVSDVVVNGRVAAKTMTIPVSVNWGSDAPDAGTKVVVTFTNGASTESVELTGSGAGTWTASKELPRIDASGNPITWNVTTAISPSGSSATVTGAPATVSDPDGDGHAGPVALTGTVARGMTVVFRISDGYNTSQVSIKNYQPKNQYNKKGNTEYATLQIPGSTSDLIDSDDAGPVGYIFQLQQVYKTGTDNQYRVTVRSNATNAGYVYDYGDCIWFYYQPGEVVFDIVVGGQYSNPSWNENNRPVSFEKVGNAASQQASLTAAARPSLHKAVSAKRVPRNTGSSVAAFADASVSGEGTPFTAVKFKDLPAGATPVAADGDGHDGVQTITGEDGFKWTNLPMVDADGNPIYYYVVERDATAQADTVTATYAYEYNADGTIKRVTVTNETTGTPEPTTGDITVTKSFSGVDSLPDSFNIANDYSDQVFTVANAESQSPYTWTLAGIPEGTVVTFTERGATANGFDLEVTSQGTVVADSMVSATVVAGQTVTASLVNEYTPKTTNVTLKKVDKDHAADAEADLLKGAAFTLSKYTSSAFREKDTAWGVDGSKELVDAKGIDGNYSLNGEFTFEGLEVGYYKLEETNHPEGYVQLTGTPTFQVTANASNELQVAIIDNPESMLHLVDGEMTLLVSNAPGKPLPTTGGMGTQVLTVAGMLLVLVAAALLARRRVAG